MKITLRKFCTRTDGKQTVLASLEQNGKGEFTICDGQLVIGRLLPTDKAKATIYYEALLERLMLARKTEN